MADARQFGPMRFREIAPGVWQHTSFLDMPGFGAVPSNGLLVVDGDETVLVDTAWTSDQTRALVAWAAGELGRPIRAAVVTHAHGDKMGGMAALHDAGIATYAHAMTNRMAPENDLLPARNDLTFGDDGQLTGPAIPALRPLTIVYPGPGHTHDNIAVGVRSASLAFGGCLIKGSDATSLGNLLDADTARYADSVRRFAAAFPEARLIAMSHSGPDSRKAIARTLKLAEQLRE